MTVYEASLVIPFSIPSFSTLIAFKSGRSWVCKGSVSSEGVDNTAFQSTQARLGPGGHALLCDMRTNVGASYAFMHFAGRKKPLRGMFRAALQVLCLRRHDIELTTCAGDCPSAVTLDY